MAPTAFVSGAAAARVTVRSKTAAIDALRTNRSRGVAAARPPAVIKANLQRPPRSTPEWGRSLLSVPKSLVLRNVWPQVTYSFVVSSSVVFAHVVVHSVSSNPPPPLPTLAHTFCATALGMLLVFRTNAAYDRFWEGRKIWGAVVNTSRNNTRQARAFLPKDTARDVALMTVAFAYALAQRLNMTRDVEPCRSIVAERSEEHADRITVAANKPLECCLILTEIVAEGFRLKEMERPETRVSTQVERHSMEVGINDMIDHLGKCERISTTPVPLSYSRHTTRLLSLFLGSLPFVLVGQSGGPLYTIPLTVFLTWAMSGIDEVAHMIEDPFLHEPFSLPLMTISGKIEKDALTQVCLPPEEEEVEEEASIPSLPVLVGERNR